MFVPRSSRKSTARHARAVDGLERVDRKRPPWSAVFFGRSAGMTPRPFVPVFRFSQNLRDGMIRQALPSGLSPPIIAHSISRASGTPPRSRSSDVRAGERHGFAESRRVLRLRDADARGPAGFTNIGNSARSPARPRCVGLRPHSCRRMTRMGRRRLRPAAPSSSPCPSRRPTRHAAADEDVGELERSESCRPAVGTVQHGKITSARAR